MELERALFRPSVQDPPRHFKGRFWFCDLFMLLANGALDLEACYVCSMARCIQLLFTVPTPSVGVQLFNQEPG